MLSAIKEEPLEYCYYIDKYFDNEDTAEELIELYQAVLPLDEMADGMGDYFFPDNLQKEKGCLDHILPLLAKFPMKGIRLINTGLNSSVTRNRNMACRAISGWVKELDKPIADISTGLYSEIIRLHEIEVNKDTKETMKKLITGEYMDE